MYSYKKHNEHETGKESNAKEAATKWPVFNRICKPQDTRKLEHFLDKDWKWGEQHILATSK